jgi:glycosyltransferase involved in cell wall biosynthesis
MHAMDVLASSSAWGEAFPNVLGEAMACGIPCVATDVGDSAYIIGDTGMVVPPSDSKALANALIAILKKNDDEIRRLGHAARKRVERFYSIESVVLEYTNFYTSLLERQE